MIKATLKWDCVIVGEFLWNSNISLACTNLNSFIIFPVMDENKIHEMESMIGKSDLLSSLGKISLSSGSEKRACQSCPCYLCILFYLILWSSEAPKGQEAGGEVWTPAQEGLSDTQTS